QLVRGRLRLGHEPVARALDLLRGRAQPVVGEVGGGLAELLQRVRELLRRVLELVGPVPDGAGQVQDRGGGSLEELVQLVRGFLDGGQAGALQVAGGVGHRLVELLELVQAVVALGHGSSAYSSCSELLSWSVSSRISGIRLSKRVTIAPALSDISPLRREASSTIWPSSCSRGSTRSVSDL